MGTSQSSTGSPSGVPLIPPWVPDPEVPNDDQGNGVQPEAPPSQPAPIAPARRFQSARLNLGNFSQTGSSEHMRRGVGHYVQSGLGGTRTATRRFEGTARTADSLYRALAATAEGRPPVPGSPLDPEILAGRPAQEIMDSIVEAVRTVDGTQDGEASRKAIRDALSDLLTRFPDADLLNLTEDERSFVVERYVALDVYNRINLDVGKAIQDNAPSPQAALSRLRDVKEYAKETVSAAFRKLRELGQVITSGRVGQIVRSALKETFEVFEEYV